MNLPYRRVYGGANRSNRRLTEALAAARHEVHVVVPAAGTEADAATTRNQTSTIQGVLVHEAGSQSALRIELARLIEAVAPDWILVSSEDPSQSLLRVALDCAPGRVVYLAHTPQMFPFGEASLYPGQTRSSWIGKAAAIIVISRFMQDYVRESSGLDAFLFHPPHYDAPSAAPRGTRKGHVLLLNACAQKGISIFEAIARRMPEVPFATVIGYGTTSQDLDRIRALPNVRLLPNPEHLEEFFNQSSVLLVPSLWLEGFGMAAIDAMLSGIPVLAADFGGLREASLDVATLLPVSPIKKFSIEHDERNLPRAIVPPQNAEPWVEALRDLLSDNERYQVQAERSLKAAAAFQRALSVQPLLEFLAGLQPKSQAAPILVEQSKTRRRIEALTPENRAALIRLLQRTGSPEPSIPVVSMRSSYPLSSSQERLWFLQQLDPASVSYNLAIAVRIGGPLDVARLESSLSRLVQRHAALRTVFKELDGRPVQVPLPPIPQSLAIVDLSLHFSPVEEARQRIGSTTREPFSLGDAPPFRCLLVHLGEQDHVLAIICHHIIADGWSLSILSKDWASYYRSDAELPPLPIQFTDFAVWQRTIANSAEDLEYWKRQLKGLDRLELPLDHQRSVHPRFRGGTHPFLLSQTLTDGLRQLALANQATLFMVLIAVFHLLLHRYSGQSEIATGSPEAGRRKSELEGLVGSFVETIILRSSFAGNPSFRKLLACTRQTTLDAYRHNSISFERLVEELHPERDLSSNPLFQVMLVLQNTPGLGEALSDFEFEPFATPRSATQFDFTIGLTESSSGLLGAIEYDSDLFEGHTIEKIALHLESLVRQIISDPGKRVGEYCIEPYPWAKSGKSEPTAWDASMLPHRRFEQCARLDADATAIYCAEDVVSYGQLNTRANRIAAHLRARGVESETPVAICLDPGPDMVAALLAIFKCGATYVPLDPRWPAARIKLIRDEVEPVVTLTNDVIVQALSKEAANIPAADTLPETAAYVLYTSGSSGRPKGVVMTYGNVSGFLAWATTAFHSSDLRCVLAATSLCFDLSVFEIFAPLCSGGAIRIVHDIISAAPSVLAGITLLNTVPSVASALLRSGAFPAGVHAVTLAGEPLSRELADAIYNHSPATRVFDLYGPTETTTFSTWTLRRSGDEPTIGVPIDGTEVLILDSYGNPTPTGVFGEIQISGRGVSRGYWKQPSLTAERFAPHPFRAGERLYRTGDRGRWRHDGRIEYGGRRDRQIKVRGFRIEPEEIERTLLQAPSVREAFVAGRNGVLVAWVAGQSDSEQVLAFARTWIPSYAIPSRVIVLHALPRLPNGKADAAALMLPEEATSWNGVWPSPTAEILAGIWGQVLTRAVPSPEANFFDLGGHSLLAVQVVSRIRDVLRTEMPLRSIFEYPVLRSLAARIETTQVFAAPPNGPQVGDAGDFPLSFAQARMWYLDAFRPDDPSYNIPSAVHVRGDLNREALAGALRHLIRRHGSLRTVFPAEGIQRVLPDMDVPVSFIDLTRMKVEAAEIELRRLLHLETRVGFDLAEGPLMRVTLVRMGPEHHVLAVTMHHICSDAWSSQILLTEWIAYYQAERDGVELRLPELAISYAGYAVWQRSQIAAGSLQRSVEYWKRQLEDIPRLEFPVDRPRASYLANEGAVILVHLGKEWVTGLRRICHEESATLFMGLSALWFSALWRYTRQDEIAVGVPLAGRSRTETENLIGCFVNTVCLRVHCGDAPSFRRLLRRVRDAAIEAYSHQDVPLETLIEQMQLRPRDRRASLFQTMITLQNVPPRQLENTALQLEPLEIFGQKAKSELSLSLHEGSSTVSGVLEYDTGLFNAESAAALLDTNRKLLDAFLRDPDQSIGGPVVGPAANVAKIPAPGEPLSWLSPPSDLIALRDKTGTWTYRQLHEFANGVASSIQARALGPEDLVGVCLPRGRERIGAFVGVLKAGAVFLGLDPDIPAERFSRLISEAPVGILIADSTPPAAVGVPILHPTEIPARSEEPVMAHIYAENLAYVVFTSGSTGKPKCVGLTHKGLSQLATSISQHRLVDSADRVLQFASPAFDAFIWEMLMALGSGAELWVGDRDGPATIGTVPPSYASALSQRSDLRTVVFAGEACHRNDVARLLPGRRVYNAYGPSEATVCSTMQLCTDADSDPPIGRPLAHVRAFVVDPYFHQMPVGAIGEICIGGDCIARGYLNDPALTADRMVPDPFSGIDGERLYRTGDYGRLLPSGDLIFVGRRDQQIKLHGYRIELGEIEAAINRIAGVQNAVVLLVGGRLVAYVQSELPVQSADTRATLQRELPGYMLPAAWVRVEEFPLTTTGKVDRAAVASIFRPAREDEHLDPPRNAAEHLLATLWAQQLQLPAVGIHQDFFELGGDSILAIRILARAKEQGLRLFPRQVYDYPTVAGLAGVGEWITPVSEATLAVAALSPIQRWLMEQHPADPLHFHQAQLLLPLVDLQPEVLAAAVLDVYRHHDALRLAFRHEDAGWIQRILPASDRAFTLIDLDADNVSLAQAISHLDTGFDIRLGECFKVALLRWTDGNGRPGVRIWIGMHALAADEASWGVLLEDLQSAYEQRLQGASAQFSRSLMPFLNWAHSQPNEGNASPIPSPSVPRESGALATAGSIATITFEVAIGSHSDLERKLAEAVGKALRLWMNVPGIAVDVERSCRNTRTLRTVGRLTEIIPLWITDDGLEELDPFRPGANVIVRYLGPRDTYLPQRPWFVPAPEMAGENGRCHLLRSHALEITGSIQGNRLRLSWTYSRDLHAESVVLAIAQTCGESLSRRLLLSGDIDSRFPDAEDVLELTPLQEGLIHFSDAPTSAAYHQQVICSLPGSLIVDMLLQAWEMVVANHPSLRAAFFLNIEGARPLQVIYADCHPEWVKESWVGLNEDEFTSRLLQYLKADQKRGFALDRPPLLRFGLFEKSEKEWVLVWSHHHLLLDGWSIPIVVGQVTETYSLLSQGLPIPFRRSDYLRRFVEWLKGQREKEAQEFWVSRLAGVEQATMLPMRNTLSSKSAAADSGIHSLFLTPDQTALLDRGCRQARCTLASLATAAWALVLSRFDAVNEVVFGITFALRPPELSGSETAVGLFLNTLPICIRLDPDQVTSTWLIGIRDSLEEMRRYGYVSLAQVRRWTGGSTETPLFDSILVVENFPQTEGGGPAPSVGISAIGRTHFPVSVGVMPGPSLGLRLTYDRLVLQESDSEFLLHSFSEFLIQIAQSLDGKVELLRLPEGDPEIGAGPTVLREAILLHELFERQARATPDNVAVIRGSEAMSYADLDDRANDVALRLIEGGVKPDTLVGIRLERGPELAIAALAVLKAGGAYLLLDPDSSDLRQAAMIEDCGCLLILDSIETTAAPRPALWMKTSPHPSNLAYVVFTSGSTGKPKSCEIEHHSIVNRILWSQTRYPLSPKDRVLQSAQLGFDFVIWELHAPWAAGAAVVFPEPHEIRDMQALSSCIERHQVTVAHFIPAALAVLLEQPVRPSLRLIFCGGERLHTHLVEQFFSLYQSRLVNQYGPAEAAIDVTHHECARGIDMGVVPIGRPIDNAQIHVLDKRDVPLPIGAVGEIFIGGQPVARGYRNAAQVTSERLFRTSPHGRLYRTGDLGRWRTDGTLEFLGRADRQIKVRGFRIEPAEIEARLASFVGVRQCAVLPRKKSSGATDLVAFLVWESESVFLARQCSEFLEAGLPEYMVPSSYIRIDEIPLTHNGKMDTRRMLLLANASEASTGNSRLAGTIEDLCHSVWQRVLGLASIRSDDNFFELGGDSISATRVAIRLSEALGRQVSVRLLLEHPVLAHFANSLDLSDLLPRLHRLPRAKDGSAPLSIAQLHLWILHAATQGSPLFHIPVTVKLEGEINVGAMSRAVQELVEDFEILRTVFPLGPDGPIQQILPVSENVLEVRDCAAVDPVERDGMVAQLVHAMIQTAFDLDHQPPFRALLIRLAPKQFQLTICCHHIACDAWSLDVIGRRIAAGYQGTRLPRPAWQYTDFARLETQAAANGDLEKQLSYWESNLQDLPAQKPRPPYLRKHAAGMSLSAKLTTSIRTLAVMQNATPFMLCVAAFELLLFELTGETDSCVATLVANRDLPGMEEQVGLFVNTVLLRARVHPADRFIDLLHQVRHTILEAHSNRMVPFPMVVERLEESGVERSSLCRALIVFQNAASGLPEMDGVHAIPLGVSTESSPAPTTFEWILTAGLAGETMSLHLTCPADEDNSVRNPPKVLHSLRRILECVAITPGLEIEKVMSVETAT